MIDCALLERPGRWRAVAVATILCLTVLSALPLFWQSFWSVKADTTFAGSSFLRSLGGSLAVAVSVSGIALLVGFPAGVLAALYEFPGRRFLLALATLPLITPSFLWAIGWSKLAIWMWPMASQSLSWLGPYLVFSALTVPLVLWSSFAAALTLSPSQLDSARLAGGEAAVVWNSARQAAVPGMLAGLLGGVLTLSDGGPDQIFGSFRAASQILVSFSALNDYELAGRQCVVLAGLVLALAFPMALLAGPRLAEAVLSRQVGRPRRARVPGIALAGTMLLLMTAVPGTVLPLAGIALPLLEETSFARAWAVVERTWLDTLMYAGGGAAVAVLLGFGTALAVGRDDRLRKFAIVFSVAAFSLPPALPALGAIQLGARGPSWADFFMRSEATVCLALGFRFLPVALLLGLRSWATMSPSWALAAAVHGVPFAKYLGFVVLPHLASAAAASFLLVALLSTADLTTVLLLHPPGSSSLPLSIFTVMANARESLVASLCMTYFGLGLATLALGTGSWSALSSTARTRSQRRSAGANS